MGNLQFQGWPPEALEWFDGLEQNNNREWFQAHRSTYDEAVRGPLEALLAELAGEFGDAKVSRPNRDIRFSADKSPYKLQIYAIAGRGDTGLYVQLRRDGLFAGGGMYMPDRDRLAAVRSAIEDERTGAELERIIADLGTNGLQLMHDGSLKTVPRGYPADHPRAHLLRLKHFAAGTMFEPEPWFHTPAAKEKVAGAWRAATPLLSWLEATGPGPAPS